LCLTSCVPKSAERCMRVLGSGRVRVLGGEPVVPAGVARPAGQRAHGAGQVQQAAPQPEREARIEEGSDAEPGEPPSGGW
jgi:hypothetical protein